IGLRTCREEAGAALGGAMVGDDRNDADARRLRNFPSGRLQSSLAPRRYADLDALPGKRQGAFFSHPGTAARDDGLFSFDPEIHFLCFRCLVGSHGCYSGLMPASLKPCSLRATSSAIRLARSSALPLKGRMPRDVILA